MTNLQLLRKLVHRLPESEDRWRVNVLLGETMEREEAMEPATSDQTAANLLHIGCDATTLWEAERLLEKAGVN